MANVLDKLKKQLEKEVEVRITPLLETLDEIKRIQEEQLKVLKEIKKLLESR